jgi:WD40 repeat protein
MEESWEDSRGQCSWDALPTELLLSIFGFLGRRHLLSCSLVCFHWANCSRIPRLWLRLLLETWPDAHKLKKRRVIDWFHVASVVDVTDRNWVAKRHVSREIAAQPKGVIDFLLVGRSVVSCGLHKTLFVMDLQSRARTELLGHEHHVCALALCGSSLLASSSYDSTIALWDTHLWQRTGVLAGHTGPVLDAKVVDGTRLLSRGRDGFLRYFNDELLFWMKYVLI